MRKIEVEFLESFKHLDRLCGDMFSCQNGVSEYISQMEQAPFSAKISIPNWASDYQLLKHLRWINNRIKHDNTDSDCTEADLDDLDDFYHLIMDRKDPLALLAQSEFKSNRQAIKPDKTDPLSFLDQGEHKQNHQAIQHTYAYNYNKAEPIDRKKSHSFLWFFLGVIVGAIATFLIIRL